MNRLIYSFNDSHKTTVVLVIKKEILTIETETATISSNACSGNKSDWESGLFQNVDMKKN